MITSYNTFYENLDNTKDFHFNGDKKRELEVEFGLDKTIFKNCSEREIIDYLLKNKNRQEKAIDALSNKIDELLKLQAKDSPNGFFTLSNSLGEMWDNDKDDEWDKYL